MHSRSKAVCVDRSRYARRAYFSIAVMMEKKSKALVEVFCDYKKQKKSKCCVVLQALCLVFTGLVALVSLISMVIIWKSGLIDDMISQNLVLEKDTRVYDVWVKPPVKPILNIYLFNYTNIPQYAAGTEKLKIQEVGPYAYRISFEKVRVVFKTNNTVSFQEKKYYHFMPLISKGSLDDVIIVPNIALLGAVAQVLDKNVLVKLSLATVIGGLSVETFRKLTVQELLWGYEDRLFDLARPILNLVKDVPDKLGLLVGKNSTGDERFTIYTGQEDINQLGIVAEYNNEKRLRTWRGAECNRLDGSEGSMFPPPKVARKERVFVFLPQLCRRMPFTAERHLMTNGMSAVRYSPPEDVFDNDLPDNRCFCNNNVCPPKGIFDIGPCTYGGPFLASFPHFYMGDPALLAGIEGLNPSKEKHQFFIDIHDRFGVPLSGKSRLQINIVGKQTSFFPSMRMFKKDTTLPMIWFEVSVDDLPPEVKLDLKLATHTASHGLMYFLLLMFVVSSVLIAYHATKVTRLKEPIVTVYKCEKPMKMIP